MNNLNVLLYCRKSDNINATMKTEVKNKIISKIKHNNLNAFSVYDFLEYGNYKTISKTLERLVKNDVMIRVITGVYSLKQMDNELNLPILPSVDDVCLCIAKKNNWIIGPDENKALNDLGLSTQVPAKYVYLSTGPSRKYFIYNTEVVFKKTSFRYLFGLSEISQLLVQSLKALGKNNISMSNIKYLKNNIDEKDKKIILSETTFVQPWIRNYILDICSNDSCTTY